MEIHGDLYALLGVTEAASSATIRQAYRNLMKRHHPDRAGVARGEVAAALNHAIHHLGDPARRRAYDRSRRPTATALPRIVPPVRLPPRGVIRHLVGLTTVATAMAVIASAAALQSSAPATPAPEVIDTGDLGPDGAVDRATLQLVTQQASLDLDWIAVDAGAAGAERFSRRCYGGLAPATPSLLLFCGAVDARGARLFRQPPAYFSATRRRARFAAAARHASPASNGLWRRLEAEAELLRIGERAIPAAARPDLRLPPLPDNGGRIDVAIGT